MQPELVLSDRPNASSDLSVAVIGGGLAGMSAAIEARRRGARVVIFDKIKRLGGRVASYEFGQSKVRLDLCERVLPPTSPTLDNFHRALGVGDLPLCLGEGVVGLLLLFIIGGPGVVDLLPATLDLDRGKPFVDRIDGQPVPPLKLPGKALGPVRHLLPGPIRAKGHPDHDRGRLPFREHRRHPAPFLLVRAPRENPQGAGRPGKRVADRGADPGESEVEGNDRAGNFRRERLPRHGPPAIPRLRAARG